jgi:hypothetical protein
LLVALLLISWMGPARADFLDDDTAHATELAARRHKVETRLVESWLRALGLSEPQIAARLAAMSDEDLHRAVTAPQTLWIVGRGASRR